MKIVPISQEKMQRSLCINCFRTTKSVQFRGWDGVAAGRAPGWGWGGRYYLKLKDEEVVTEGCGTRERKKEETPFTPSQLACDYPEMCPRDPESSETQDERGGRQKGKRRQAP